MSQNYPAIYNKETGLYMPDQSMFDDNDVVNGQYTNCPSQTPAFRKSKQPISRIRRSLPDIDPSYPQHGTWGRPLPLPDIDPSYPQHGTWGRPLPLPDIDPSYPQN